MRHPLPHFHGEPDFVARMKALYLPEPPTVWQRVARLWRTLGADLLALCLVPVVLLTMCLMLFLVWVLDGERASTWMDWDA